MATTLIEIQEYLNEAELKYRVEQAKDSIVLSFSPMSDYVCPATGEDAVVVVIQLEEDGEFIKVFSPYAFTAEGVAFPDVAIRSCMELCYRTKGIQAEFDPDDGEVRMIIEFPLEDANLTSRQLHRCIQSLTGIIDEFSPIFHNAASTGEVDWTAFGPHEPSIERMELADLMQAVGGVEGLRDLLRSRGA